MYKIYGKRYPIVHPEFYMIFKYGKRFHFAPSFDKEYMGNFVIKHVMGDLFLLAGILQQNPQT